MSAEQLVVIWIRSENAWLACEANLKRCRSISKSCWHVQKWSMTLGVDTCLTFVTATCRWQQQWHETASLTLLQSEYRLICRLNYASDKHPANAFIFVLFSFTGHLHLLRLRKVGSAKEGGFHVWIQVLRRQRPELISLCKFCSHNVKKKNRKKRRKLQHSENFTTEVRGKEEKRFILQSFHFSIKSFVASRRRM